MREDVFISNVDTETLRKFKALSKITKRTMGELTSEAMNDLLRKAGIEFEYDVTIEDLQNGTEESDPTSTTN